MAENNTELKKPRVLLVGPGLNLKGGISTVLNTYFESELPEKVDFKFIQTMEDGSKLKKLFIALKAYISFLRSLKKYDIVHVHMAAQASFTRKALFIKKAYKKNKKIIIHQHAGGFDEFFLNESSKRKQKKIKKVFSLAEKVIVLSKEKLDFFIQNRICPENKILVVYNGVKIPPKKEKDYSNTNVVFLGRINENKGIYDLINAIPLILNDIPNANFYFAGDGELIKAKELAERLGIQQNVHFVGWLVKTEIEKIFEKCSVLVFPSYFEAMPMSILEAMSYGLAVITTPVGGIPQIVQNEVDGIFIEPGDVNDIAKAITKIFLDEKKKQYIGENAVQKVKKEFSIDMVAEKMYGIYKDLC